MSVIRTSRVALAFTVLVSAAIVGCSSSDPSDGATSVPAIEEPTPAESFAEGLASRLGPGGTIDKQLALDLYASAYGHAAELGASPLPGMNTEGSQALNAVLQHWDELSAAQQALITADMAISPARSVTVEPSDLGGGGAVRAPQVFDEPAATIIQNAANQIAVSWGSGLPVPVRIDIMAADLPRSPSGGVVLADAHVENGAGTAVTDPTTYALCVVRVFPALTPLPRIDQIATLAHETFHCFQFVGRTYGTLAELGQWVVEGQAQWVGATIAGGGSVATDWWRVWLRQAHSLWTRSYDAMGLYASLARRGENVWNVFHRMLDGSPDFASMYATMAGSRGTALLGDVSVDHSALTDVGAPWMPEGPGAPTREAAALALEVTAGGSRTFTNSVEAFDTTRFAAQVLDPVVIVSSDTAPWAVGVQNKYQVQTATGDVALCLQRECVCPDGQLLAALVVGDHLVVGIGVGNATLLPVTVSVLVKGVAIDAACELLPRLPAGPSECMVGRWQLTEQVFGADFLPGIAAAGLTGGVGGRVLEIRADGTYTMTDDGSDPTVGNSVVGGVPVAVSVMLTGQVDGTVTVSADVATFESTASTVHLHLEETLSGVAPIVVDEDLGDSSVFGNGRGAVTCSGDSLALALAFANATFRYQRT